MAKATSFTRGDAKPSRHGWHERAYPPIAGRFKHPCPFDYWNGSEWLAGFPDAQSAITVPALGLGLVHKHKAGDQALAWRKLDGVKRTEAKT